MGGVKEYDPFAFVAFSIWAFFLYFIISSNSPINPVAQNVTITAQFGIAYNNTKWILYLLVPMLPYLILRFWHHADTEEESLRSGGLRGFSHRGNIRGHFKSIQRQIQEGERPKPKPNKIRSFHVDKPKSEIEA